MLCNFGLKSYLWFQIMCTTSAQTALHSIQLPLLKSVKASNHVQFILWFNFYFGQIFKTNLCSSSSLLMVIILRQKETMQPLCSNQGKMWTIILVDNDLLVSEYQILSLYYQQLSGPVSRKNSKLLHEYLYLLQQYQWVTTWQWLFFLERFRGENRWTLNL